MNFDDIFKIYVNVPIYGVAHLFSTIVLVLAVILPFYILRKRKINIVYKFTIMVVMGLMSKAILEMEYFVGMGMMDWWDLVIGIVSILALWYYNRKLGVIKFNWFFTILVVLQVMTIGVMWSMGFFDVLKVYLTPTGGPDPHNLVWGISKLNGMLMWLVLIQRRDKPREIR